MVHVGRGRWKWFVGDGSDVTARGCSGGGSDGALAIAVTRWWGHFRWGVRKVRGERFGGIQVSSEGVEQLSGYGDLHAVEAVRKHESVCSWNIGRW